MSKPYLISKTHFNQKDNTGVNKYQYNDISMYTFFTCIATDVNYFNYIQCILSLYNKNIHYPHTAQKNLVNQVLLGKF